MTDHLDAHKASPEDEFVPISHVTPLVVKDLLWRHFAYSDLAQLTRLLASDLALRDKFTLYRMLERELRSAGWVE